MVAANGDLKLDVRRARAEILVLNTERKGLEERFLLRTPSPTPTPPSGDLAAAGSASGNAGGVLDGGGGGAKQSESVANDDGSANEGGRVPREGSNESGGEGETAGGTSAAGTNLDHTTPAGGGNGDRAGSENSLTRTAGNRQADGAIGPELKVTVVAIADGGDGGPFEPAGVEATRLKVEVSGRRGDGAPGFEGSSRSESDVDSWASIDRGVFSRSPRSSNRKAFDSCDSASSEGDPQDTPAELADLGNRASGGEASSTVQATAGAIFGKSFEHNNIVGRSGRRRTFSTWSLPSNLAGACSDADKKGVGTQGIGGLGTSAEPTHPHSASLPGSFLVVRDGGTEEAGSRAVRADTSTLVSQLEERDASLLKSDGVADGVSGDESSSTSEAKGDVWSSASFIAAKANAEATSGDDDKGGAQAMANFPPLDKASSAVKQPRVRRHPRGNEEQKIISYFLDDSSQSSAGSRSPGG